MKCENIGENLHDIGFVKAFLDEDKSIYKEKR